MLQIWTQKSGYSFGTIQERSIVNQQLPVSYADLFNDSTNVSFSVISGQLPPGLRIEEDRLVGTPFEVPRSTLFRFVIRAQYGTDFADRTFSITVAGEDAPEWQTPAGPLPVGTNDAYYILDSSYIDFQLVARDYDTAAGQTLRYFIASGNGELPPGLVLTASGRIVGWVQPTLAIPETAGNGYYDMAVFDEVAYDFGYRPSNGFDTYIYDNKFYDFSAASSSPRKLNRNYEFVVTITDGDTAVNRKFRIFVVGDDYFRSDNIIFTAGNGTYTVDASYVRAPIWVTPKDLGRIRANNYKTFKLDIYEGLDVGQVEYTLEPVNADVTGLAYTITTAQNRAGTDKIKLKNVTGIPLAGQRITLKNYVVNASERIFTVTDVEKLSNTEYIITLDFLLDVNILNNTLLVIGSLGNLPPGMTFDSTTGECFGVIPYQPAITKTYQFTVSAKRFSDTLETATSYRKFTVQVLGEIESTITWDTDSYLGSLEANLVSTFFVKASTTLVGSNIFYSLVSGSLPPGLSLSLDGEIVGKVKQYGDSIVYRATWRPGRTYNTNDVVLYDGKNYKANVSHVSSGSFDNSKWDRYFLPATETWQPGKEYLVNDIVIFEGKNYRSRINQATLSFIAGQWTEYPGLSGITTIDNNNFTLDSSTTTLDKVYTIVVEAKDLLGNSAITKEFTLEITTPNDRLFSNLIVRPFLKEDQRALFKSFITDSDVFDISAIYRPSDPNFGIQSDLKMLIFAGIETKTAAEVVSVVGRNHKPKRFHLGAIKSAQAKTPGTNNVIYEVVYIEVLDPLEIGEKHLDLNILTSPSNREITVDQSNQYYNGPFDTVERFWKKPDPFSVSIDRNDILAGDPNTTVRQPSSVWAWRKRIRELGLQDRFYLPLWMRTIQDGTVQELGYTKAIPLCYCKPGRSADILLNIKNYLNTNTVGFDFNKIEYVVDRYIIDSVTGYSADKYIVFRNDRTTI